MIASITVRKERMAAAASDPALMATDVAEMLVRRGVPFRHAHHRVGAFVKWCKEHGKALNEVTLDEMKQTIPEADAEFLTLFSPQDSIAAREVFGATGPQQVRRQIDFWKKNLTISE